MAADGAASEGRTTFSGDNEMNCDSCHQPHDADTDGGTYIYDSGEGITPATALEHDVTSVTTPFSSRLPSSPYEQWRGEDVTLPREETCPGLDTVIDSGRLSLTFEKGFLTTITDSNTGQQWQASESVCSVFPFVNVHRGRVIREHERANQGKYRRETAGHSPSLSGSIAGCI